MNAERISNFIKKVKEKNNLTDGQLAAYYNVTKEEVIRWENCQELPDINLLKKMINDYDNGVKIEAIEELKEEIAVEEKKTKIINRHLYHISILSAFLIISILVLIKQLRTTETYRFKTMSTNCDSFKITGNIGYDKTISSLYLTNINYCGGNDKTVYDDIEATLYLKDELINTARKRRTITLEEYLQDSHFDFLTFRTNCAEYRDDSLHLEVIAKKDNDIVSYRVNLNMNNSCKNN